MSQGEIEPLLYSVPDTGKMLGISRSTAWAMVRAGKIETVKIGCRTLVPGSVIKALAHNGA